MACLAKEPADRPASAAELARLLAAVGVEPWMEEDAARWWGHETEEVSAAGSR